MVCLPITIQQDFYLPDKTNQPSISFLLQRDSSQHEEENNTHEHQVDSS